MMSTVFVFRWCWLIDHRLLCSRKAEVSQPSSSEILFLWKHPNSRFLFPVHLVA